MNEDPRDQIIDAAYRRASEAEAGGPSAGTRAAILAEAEAASRRRAPVANDSRYRWGAVAAVAVIGLGVLIWRQTDVRMPGELPASAMVMESAEDMDLTASRSAPAPVSDASAPAARAPAVSQVAAERARTKAGEMEVAREARVAGSAQDTAAPLSPEDAAKLVRENFPDQYQSTSAHRLWLVRTRDGQVLQSGELQASQDWSHVEEQLRGLQGHTPGPWQRQQLRNGAGQLIEISVSEVDLGESQR